MERQNGGGEGSHKTRKAQQNMGDGKSRPNAHSIWDGKRTSGCVVKYGISGGTK